MEDRQANGDVDDDERWTGVTTTTVPAMASKQSASERKPWSVSAQAPTTQQNVSKGPSARERKQLCREQELHGDTPNLQLPEDTAIGNGHRSAASAVSANNQQAETP